MTPVGPIYAVDGLVCRAFLADLGGKAGALRLQARGCRGADGQWAVSDVKPFAA
jgi:hypothetical protein